MLLAALIGGTVLGVVGALMAIPVLAAVKAIMTPMVEELTEAAPEQDQPPPSPSPVPVEPTQRPATE